MHRVLLCQNCESSFDYRTESQSYVLRSENKVFELPDESPQVPPPRPRSCPPDASRKSWVSCPENHHQTTTDQCQNLQVEKCYLDIQFYDSRNDCQNAVALLDTGCHMGNLISWRKLREIGLQGNLDTSEQPDGLSACGRRVSCLGAVVLELRSTNIWRRVIKAKFFVIDVDHIDAILGAELLFTEKLVTINAEVPCAPFTPHKPPRAGKILPWQAKAIADQDQMNLIT